VARTESRVTITPLYSTCDELSLPVSTYVISGGPKTIVVDPGPGWHLARHIDVLRGLIYLGAPLTAVVQSAGTEVFSGLSELDRLADGGVLVLHWKTIVGGANVPNGWRVRTLTTRNAALTINTETRLIIGAVADSGPPGALMALETGTGTLFTGPFYGSLGPGRNSDRPELRRESLRAYRDTFTPGVPENLVELTFGENTQANQIAPCHGRIEVGGPDLIRSVLGSRDGPTPPETVFDDLYLRIAAVAGEDAAASIYRGSGLPIPEPVSSPGDSLRARDDQPTRTRWLALLAALEQWLPGSALSAIFPLAARLAAMHGLPVSRSVSRFGRGLSSTQGDRQRSAPAESSEVPSMLTPHRMIEEEPPVELTCPVTGLMNEVVFRRRLAGQIESLERWERSGAVIVVGIDNMQRINATHGRKGGDETLHAIGYLLRNFQSASARRGAHRLYKLAGPYFAYVLAEGSAEEGAEVAERIRRAVSESTLFLERLTISIGVTGLDEVRPDRDTKRDAAEIAEKVTSKGFARLRFARSSGANTVCSRDPSQAAGIWTGSTVLIADPDAPYLETLTAQLEQLGYTVLVARDGEEAIDTVNEVIPDVIVAEVMLPKQNGFALRERLRHDAVLSRIPFILVSHRKNEETIGKAAMLGIVHFLAKPFSLVELIGLLRNLTPDDHAISDSHGELRDR
jgi:diguanylate cyclase (GGDEF)-like protein